MQTLSLALFRITILVSVTMCLPCQDVCADDWTQWAGNRRDCTWNEDGILSTFPEGGLKPDWVVPISSGYSGPVVSDGRIIVTDYRPVPETRTLEAVERVLCLDESTGKTLWEHSWKTNYRRQMQSYATGPRATPLIKDGRVYALGAAGHLCCLDMQTGAVVWETDATEQFGAQVPVFGFAAAPVAWKDTVIFACGGSDGLLRALDGKTGKEVWKALPADHDLPYSAPEIMTFEGRPQLVQWSQEQLGGFDPDTGQPIWSVPFHVKANMAIARPVRSGPLVLVSGFYDGSMLVRVSANDATMVWKNGGSGERPHQTKSLHAVITTPIIQGDYFYGTCSYGELRGLSLKDGERIWENKELTRQGRWGSMFWARHKDRYFVNNDLGELLIVRFSPEGPTVIDRTKLIEPDTECGYGPRRFANALVNWVQPAYANRHVVIRNDSEIRRVSLESSK